MDTIEKIKNLCVKNGTSITALCKQITGSSGNLPTWKSGNIRNEHLIQIAELFNVSIDFLLGRVEKTPSNTVTFRKIIRVPVIGEISAHYDGSCREELIDEIDIPESALRGYPQEDCFFLKVNGNSMYPDFINGDIVTVLKQSSVDSGTVAAILYDGESATLKRVEYKYGQDWLKLVPRNPEFETKLIEGSDLQNCIVLGRVISLVYRPIN